MLGGQPSVLIVDESEETREVLQTALGRHGVRTFATGQVRRGLQLARQHRPDLIVLDLELNDSDPEDFSAPAAAPASDGGPRLVLLGTFRKTQGGSAEGEFVAKPYHYAALIRKIERLLETSPSMAVRCD